MATLRKATSARIGGTLALLATSLALTMPAAVGAEAEPAKEPVALQQTAQKETAVHLFDTVAPSAKPLASDAIGRRDGWIELAEDDAKHVFSGAAVLMNDRLAVVLRRGGAGVEVYGRSAQGFRLRALLTPARAQTTVTGVAVVENSASAAAIEVAYQASDGSPRGMRCELAMGQPFLKTEASRGTTTLALNAVCRYLVLPDFFADDMVIDAGQLRPPGAELPCENFLLHLLPGGDSLVMAVATQRDDDVWIKVAGDRQIERSEIPYGDQGKIWVAVIEEPGVWHEHAVTEGDAGKTIALDWHPPFPAQWRVDWRQSDTLTGSWEMIAQRKDGQFERYAWFGTPEKVGGDRRRWTTVLGWFPYPCWIEQDGTACLQPLAKKPVKFEGPALIYPINRTRQTPLDRFTVTDLVRGTLGVGPCEYILDLEGQRAAMRGRSTCGTRDALKAIYEVHEQKKRRADVEQILAEVVQFVTHIRGRIEQYQAFGREMLDYLEQQRREHPEVAPFLDEMQSLTRVIHGHYERRKADIKTPEYVVGLTDQFRRELLDYEEDDALSRCNQITQAIVRVGGNQDELVGECRMAVKVLRQRAGLAMAADPKAAPVAREIRRRTQQALRNPTSYEAPRH